MQDSLEPRERLEPLGRLASPVTLELPVRQGHGAILVKLAEQDRQEILERPVLQGIPGQSDLPDQTDLRDKEDRLAHLGI